MSNTSPLITRVRPDDVKERLAAAAEREHRSVSGQLRHVLEAWVDQDADEPGQASAESRQPVGVGSYDPRPTTIVPPSGG